MSLYAAKGSTQSQGKITLESNEETLKASQLNSLLSSIV